VPPHRPFVYITHTETTATATATKHFQLSLSLSLSICYHCTMLAHMDFGTRIFVTAATALSAQLVCRWLMSAKFGGIVMQFDLGTKPTGERNEAFTNELFTYGHILQSTLSALLFPSTDFFVAKWPKYYWLKHFLGLGSGIYVVYNTTKRTLGNFESFAQSSYTNNGLEWALGFWIGISIAYLLSLCKSDRLNADRMPLWLLRLRLAFGILLCCISLLALSLFLNTWRVDTTYAVIFAFVPFVVIAPLSYRLFQPPWSLMRRDADILESVSESSDKDDQQHPPAAHMGDTQMTNVVPQSDTTR
jgi:multidrug transporter EmrE-like cation transporter